MQNSISGSRNGSHLMENIIFNELILRGYAVDVGVVELTPRKRKIRRLVR
jgi:hypothetical protein